MCEKELDMKRVKLTVAYDGTNYCGWQVQPNGITIEEVLNRELSALLREPVAVIGASRTDSGVHAWGNVAIFDTENRMPADKICFAVNQKLPEDIRVIQSEEVPLDWHPRKCNGTKTYEYRILNRKISMPTERLYAHFCYYDLDLTKMQQAAEYLIGEHDFKSFCTTRTQAEETVRTIYSLDVSRTGDMVTIRISGSGFLYNMVRIIAGTLLRVGMGFYPPEHVEEILEAKDRTQAGDTAPARGLTLVSLDYEKELPPWHHRENKHWSYDILQAHIAEEKNAYLQVARCEEAELDGVLRRNIHHQFQNGAEVVYVSIAENAAAPTSTVCATADSLVQGAVHGRYRLEPCGQQEVLSALTQEEKERFSDAQWLRAVPAGESGAIF
jgi:tRNA pseudouridine38-40 synthase